MFNIDTILAEFFSNIPGQWSIDSVTDTWYVLKHEMTEQTIYLRKVGEHGAYIIRTSDDALHWTGHKLEVGFREATDHLVQHHMKR